MVVEEIRTITAKGQTTIPKTVRQALGVGYGARIAFRIENGTVTVHPADDEAADPALAPFLDLLARDIASRPEALVPLTEALIAQAERLTAGVTDDLDAPIKRVSAIDSPAIYSPPMEAEQLPHPQRILKAALSVLE